LIRAEEGLSKACEHLNNPTGQATDDALARWRDKRVPVEGSKSGQNSAGNEESVKLARRVDIQESIGTFKILPVFDASEQSWASVS
jgi:hypothetical protein